MATMIGHASKDERGQLQGGADGDQTKQEVYKRTWYNRPWNYIIRFKDPSMREKVADCMEKACDNDLIGYNQARRNTLLTQARKVNYNPSLVNVKCATDCSALVSLCCMYAGVKESILFISGNSCTTRNLRKALMDTGLVDVLTESKYVASSDNLLRGDILLYEGHHVAVNLTNGKNITTTNTPNTPNNNTSSQIKFCDISHHNTVDISKMSKEIKSVIIRLGYISYKSKTDGSANYVLDTKYIKHIEDAIKYNMNVSVYVWDQSLNEKEAIKLAEFCAENLKQYKNKITMPIFIDSENYTNNTGRADNISKDQRTRNIIAFCERIRQFGYSAGVYASESWFKNKLDFNRINNYAIWCAKYSTDKPTISKYDAWQYGSENFNWASAAIDVNYLYNAKWNEQGTSGNTSIPVIPNVPDAPIINDTTVKSDEKLVKITASSLNIRKEPNTSSTIVGNYKKDQIVHIIGVASNGWYKTDKGFISNSYAKDLSGKIVNCVMLNFRKTPNGQIIKAFPVGKTLQLLNEENGWYKATDGKDIGYVSKKYIKII